jgi:ATP-dependent Lhr-like helicase
VADYTPSLLDTLIAAGEVVWTGAEPVGERDGRIRLFLADQRALLTAPADDAGGLLERETHIVAFLARQGAAFFGAVHEAAGGGFPQETVDALWGLVWRGLVTNDTLHALRAYAAGPERGRRAPRAHRFRSRRLLPPSAEGRWSLVETPGADNPTARAAALTRQMLMRHGVVTREVTALEPVPGGFSALYAVLRRLEDTGRVRRGYFVAGLGGAQFAEPGALDRLRAERDPASEPRAVTLSATDPANPYGAVVDWPAWNGSATLRASRVAGARVVLVDGHATALPPEEPDRGRRARALALELVRLAETAVTDRRGWLIAEVNGEPAVTNAIAAAFVEAGFDITSGGLQLRVARRAAPVPAADDAAHPDDETADA